MKQNVTLVNSHWTGQAVQRFFNISAKTVYPPIPGVSSLCPWGEKENGFVCIGRLNPAKRIDHIIEILSQVRRKGEDVHLHIIGKSLPEHVRYLDGLRNRVHRAGGWISLHEDLSRQELLTLIAKHRFGIHNTPDEPFGIAVAEMIRAGCVVFTPWTGGQVEITGHDDRLHFSSVEEGAEKIVALLRSPKDLAEVRESLAIKKDLFSTEKFVRDIRQVVAEFLGES
jgi:glycosyltransferase involved in cell wall biosynthesis